MSSTPSPSSEAGSLNPSPATRLSALSMSRASEERDNAPSSSPTGASSDLTQANSKGGCWTCRLRRKKCDERREGDSCQTCIRLKLKCLGWGPKRPEWMRDKQAVETYKAEIKAQLTRQGMIRGQPRQSANSTSPSASPGVGGHHHRQQHQRHQHHQQAIAGPEPSTSSAATMAAPGGEYNFAYGDDSPYSPLTMIGPASSNASTSDTTFYGSPSTHENQSHESLLFGESLASTSTASARYHPYQYAADYQNHINPQPSSTSTHASHDQNTIEEEHVLYYFRRVQRLQYVFASHSLTDALYSIVVHEPRGSVTNSLCALANLHYTQERVAQGVASLDPNPENAMSRRFWNEAWIQLANSKLMHGKYTDTDAIAALQLLSFSQFSNGPLPAEWLTMLDLACEWLSTTGLLVDDNPKVCLIKMSYTSRFMAKTTMWLDVMSSVTLMQPPRFLSLYRRLLGGGGSLLWAGPHRLSAEEASELSMESLSGCPDDVMLAIAETSALAHWKLQEMRRGSLSYRELVRRGDTVETQLLQRVPTAVRPASAPPPSQHQDILMPPSAGPFSAPLPRSPGSQVGSGSRPLLNALFSDAAVLYLHTVLSDHNPVVPEIQETVNRAVQTLSRLPPSELDRALLFPLHLTGCLTDGRQQRELVRSRLMAQETTSIANFSRTRAVMEEVWRRRDARRGAGSVDWRQVMRERGFNLLLA